MKKKGKKKKVPRSRTLEHFHSSPCPNTKTQILEVLIKWVFEIHKKKHKKRKNKREISNFRPVRTTKDCVFGALLKREAEIDREKSEADLFLSMY